MKSCDEELLEDHALGRSGARAAEAEAHAAACAECARELAALRRERSALSAALQVTTRLDRAPTRRVGALARATAAAAGALAAAAALALAVGARVPPAPPEIMPLAPAELIAPQVGSAWSAEDGVSPYACSEHEERATPRAPACTEPVDHAPARVTQVSLPSGHGDVCE